MNQMMNQVKMKNYSVVFPKMNLRQYYLFNLNNLILILKYIFIRQVLKLCSELLNDPVRVGRIVKYLEVSCSKDSINFLLAPVCKLCHNLLMSHKLAVHKYR